MNISKEHYSSLYDFPLLNWIKCNEGEFQYINFDLVPRKEDAVNWAKMYDLYLEKFGIGKEFTRYLEKKQELIDLRNAFVQSGDEFILNEIRMIEAELIKKDKDFSESKNTIESSLVTLSKWLKMPLRIKDLTILEYKNYMLDYERANK